MIELDLADGRTVTIVPMSPTDGERLRRFHDTLSEETRRRRFFAVHPILTPEEVYRFTHVDHDEREALVAVADGDIVAVGRFDRIPTSNDGAGTTAEVAFAVSDDWQGQGIGAALFAYLADRARELGVTCFVAETMFDNRPMLALFRHAGLPIAEHVREGVVTVVMDLGGEAVSDWEVAPELVPLDQEDCWAALAGETVGRMGLPGEPPEVLPVNYALDGESIVVRVDASSSSAGFVGRQVTFEVDRYDSDLRVGWSVLASGVLEDATGDLAGASGGGGALRLEPWAPGAKDRWLRLRPARLTGRSVLGPSRAEGND